MALHDPVNVPPGVMRVLHQLEAAAYDPAHNGRAGDDYGWTADPVPGRVQQAGRWLANTAFIVAVMIADKMLGGFGWAFVDGRVQ